MKSIKIINMEIERLKLLKLATQDDYHCGYIDGEINKLIWVKDEKT